MDDTKKSFDFVISARKPNRLSGEFYADVYQYFSSQIGRWGLWFCQ
jgi:hypothetical protein